MAETSVSSITSGSNPKTRSDNEPEKSTSYFRAQHVAMGSIDLNLTLGSSLKNPNHPFFP